MRTILITTLLIMSVTTSTTTLADQMETIHGDEVFQIISPSDAHELANEDHITILDVRTAVADYQRGHVPGAVHLANDALRGTAGGLPVQYLPPESMATIFARAGVAQEGPVVVYADATDILGATMVAYCLHRLGRSNVLLMDGGIEAYQEMFPLTQKYPQVESGGIRADHNDAIHVGYDDVRELMGKDNVRILDTRPSRDYLGNTNRWIRNGHIPGAINLDWHQLTEPDNHAKFKSLQEMRNLIQATGITPKHDIIVYCGTSREATLVYHVLKHLLGFPSVRLYEGSWTEYCAIEDAPLEKEGAVITTADVAADSR